MKGPVIQTHAVTKEKAFYPSHGLGSPSKKPADRCLEANSPSPALLRRPQPWAATHPGITRSAQVLTEHLLGAKRRALGQRTGVGGGGEDKAVRTPETHAPPVPRQEAPRPQAPRKLGASVPPAVTFQGPESRMWLAAAAQAANTQRPS